MDRVRVGVVGCGAISGAYFGMAKNFPIVEITTCADLNRDAAARAAAEYGVPKVDTVDGLIEGDDCDVVLNLTTPAAHVPIALKAIAHGKHTYAEKPLGIDRDNARPVLESAEKAGVRVGCAPDTFMGACVQTARKLIDDGAIGRPVAFTALNMGRGHETWHPSPEFYYAPGGGPMLDMGPYYLTALLQLLGPMKRVGGMASIAIPERTITSEPKKGKTITVETPDHVTGTIEFENGAVGTIITTFATHAAPYDGNQPITIFGDAGTMKVGDPNNFDKPVSLCKLGEKEFTDVEPLFPTGYGRSVGLADMARAIQTGRPHRASGRQAFTVLDAMVGFLDSSRTGRAVTIAPGYERPAPMPSDLPFGELD